MKIVGQMVGMPVDMAPGRYGPGSIWPMVDMAHSLILLSVLPLLCQRDPSI